MSIVLKHSGSLHPKTTKHVLTSLGHVLLHIFTLFHIPQCVNNINRPCYKSPCPTVQCKLKLCIHWTIWSRCVATKYVANTGADGLFSAGVSVLFDQMCAWHHPPPESSSHEHQTQQMKFTHKTTAQPQSSQRCGQSNSPQAERKLLVLGLEEISNGEAATSQEVPLKRKHRRMWSRHEHRRHPTVEHVINASRDYQTYTFH